MDVISAILDFAYYIGSLVCFQLEYATFKMGEHWLPVCSGCLGIYSGVLVGALIFPWRTKLSEKIYSFRWTALLVAPMILYFLVLYVERLLNVWWIPGVKTIYFFFGVLLGFGVFNISYRLALSEQLFWLQKALKFHPIILVVIGFSFFAVLPFYSFDISVVLVASLFFLAGLTTLLVTTAAFVVKVFLRALQKAEASFGTSLALLKVLIFLLSFGFLQYLFLYDSVFTSLGVISAVCSFVFLAWMVNDLSVEEMGLVGHGWLRNLGIGILVAVILYLLFVGYHVLFRQYDPWSLLVRMSWVWIPVIVAVASSEELLFRGILFSTLEKVLGTYSSMFLCSVLFTLFHRAMVFHVIFNWSSETLFSMGEPALFNFLGSLVLNYFFFRTRSLVTPATTHSLWDILVYTGNIYAIPF